MDTPISSFVKERRKIFNLTQVDLAEKSGVGLRFVRDLEQGKPTLRLDKVKPGDSSVRIRSGGSAERQAKAIGESKSKIETLSVAEVSGLRSTRQYETI